jgi:hypothetical protein
MPQDIKLTKNFSLNELLESQTARRLGIAEQFNPSQEVIKNLKALCENILQPLRDNLRIAIAVNSGYRCSTLNKKIGGSLTSQHMTGHAADIECYPIGNEKLLKKIVELKLPFDQIINEFNYAWVHVSYDPKRNRRKVLEAYKDANNKTQYREIAV